MGPPFQTITVCRVTYRVQRVTNPEAFLLPVRFLLHSPRGRRYLLIPSKERPDRLVGIAPLTHFSLPRMEPFIGVFFAVTDDGRLVIAPPDA